MSSPTKDRILNAAERHVRAGGYHGFSFRDLASDIKIKSASVHHHFPNKETLVARLAARYREGFLAGLDPAPAGQAPVTTLRAAFRTALRQDGLMCLCGTLGSQTGVLPPSVATEARAFFEALLGYLETDRAGFPGASRDAALAIVARLEGAMLLARVLNDTAVFDVATADLDHGVHERE